MNAAAAASPPRPCARPADQLSGDLLIRARCGVGAVPGAAVGIELRIGDLRQRTVDLLPAHNGR
jgi:hypothetical protein